MGSNINENNVMDRGRMPGESIFNWYALSVRSRHEFVAAEQLKKRGVEAFLPSITKMRRWSDRSKPVTFPLFPGYLFVRIVPSAETFLGVMKTHGSVNLVSLEPGRPTPIDGDEIAAMKLMLSHSEDIDIYPHLWEGARVSVRRGPMQGAMGILVKKEDKDMFLVNVHILGRSIGMKIDAESLEVI